MPENREGMAPLIVAGLNLRQHWQDVEDYLLLDSFQMIARTGEIRRRTEETKREFLQALDDALASIGSKTPIAVTKIGEQNGQPVSNS